MVWVELILIYKTTYEVKIKCSNYDSIKIVYHLFKNKIFENNYRKEVNMTKKLLIVILLLSISSIFISNVSADLMYQGYSITVPQGKKNVGLEGSHIPGRNYRYGLNNLTKTTGRAAVHTALATKYEGNWQTISSYVKFTGAGETGDILFRAVNTETRPNGFSIVGETTCTGKNTSDTFCIIRNSQYGLGFNNHNLFYDYTVTGNLVFAD